MTSFRDVMSVYDLIPSDCKTPYHDPNYVILDAHSKKNAEPIFFIYQEGSNIYYHPIHLVYSSEFDVVDAESARGYGGPISTTLDKDFLKSADHAYIDFINQKRIVVEFIRFSPVIKNHLIYPGSVNYDRETRAIELNSYSIDIHSYRSRRYIKKSLNANCIYRYLSSPSEEYIKKYFDLYSNRMSELNATTSYLFTLDYFRKLFCCDAELVWIEICEEMIAGAVILKNASYIEYHLSASNEKGRECGATNYLIHLTAERYKNDCAVFHLGGGLTSGEADPLLAFKKTVSNVQQPYYTGSRVYNENIYQDLRKTWNSMKSNRIIFYR